MAFEVTLAGLRKAGACYDGYNKLVRSLQGEQFSDEDQARDSYIKHAHAAPINIATICESNGLDDALWALRCVSGHDRDIRLYAVWCARQVEHLMTDERSKTALNVAERHANGEASDEELDAAGAAAWAAARDAAGDAARARAAARAAAGDAARAAARAAAGDAARAGAAARDAARDGAGAGQKEMLLAMCAGIAPWQRTACAEAAQ